MRIATVIGARPQFIKAALVSKELAGKCEEIIIHTGQHYDHEMSRNFFDELKLPKPNYHLRVGSGTAGWQVGTMLEKIEKILLKEKPHLVMVYGDTNSTLAGALAAAKMNIRLAHVEAGLRSYHPTMQEEKNRVVTDHLSQILFCPTLTAVLNLKKEGISCGVYLSGDVMLDSLKFFLPLAKKRSKILSSLKIFPKSYLLATIHRAENTDDANRLRLIFEALRQIKKTILFPLHPRTAKELKKTKIKRGENIRFIEPVGYFDMLILEKNAEIILTDSGGVQKEACLLQTPCITLREETEWPETVKSGWNILTGPEPGEILRAFRKFSSYTPEKNRKPVFENRNAFEEIAAVLSKTASSDQIL